jgi:hypothetical protein
MHSKLQLLAHPTHLRVVVPSANLVPFGRPSPSGLIVLHLYSRTLSHALVTILAGKSILLTCLTDWGETGSMENVSFWR